MDLFRQENDEMSTAPFLVETIEEAEYGIKFIVALPTHGKMDTVANEISKSA